jgi:hypothetical protein
MTFRAALIGAAGVALLLALLALLWPRFPGRQPGAARVLVGGGDAGGMARVSPLQEHLDSAALEDASRDTAAEGLQALIVLRHGYIVYERFGHGYDAGTVIDSGAFAQVLLALAAGIAAHDDRLPLQSLNGFDPVRVRDAIEAGTRQSYPDYLSQRLWRRLNAAAAWIDTPAPGAPGVRGVPGATAPVPAAVPAAVPADCCFHARVLDWLRVAAVLLDDGRFEGKAVVPAGWVERMRRPVSASGSEGFGVELASAAHGAEAFAAEDVFFLRGPGRWRLWLMPTLNLGVLFGSASQLPAWDETRLPNLVIRAVSERAPQRDTGSQLRQLVPGH